MAENEERTAYLPLSSVIVDSFQEYQGEHSLVLFSFGCNLNCEFCYNRIKQYQRYPKLLKLVLESNLSPLHTAVVFLGGEPTIWGDRLENSLKLVVEKFGLKTKLFTNGTRPGVVEKCLPLLDSISIDLKLIHDPNNILGMKTDEFRISKSWNPFLRRKSLQADLVREYVNTVDRTIRLAKNSHLKDTNSIEVRTVDFDTESTSEVAKFMETNHSDVRFIVQPRMDPEYASFDINLSRGER